MAVKYINVSGDNGLNMFIPVFFNTKFKTVDDASLVGGYPTKFEALNALAEYVGEDLFQTGKDEIFCYYDTKSQEFAEQNALPESVYVGGDGIPYRAGLEYNNLKIGGIKINQPKLFNYRYCPATGGSNGRPGMALTNSSSYIADENGMGGNFQQVFPVYQNMCSFDTLTPIDYRITRTVMVFTDELYDKNICESTGDTISVFGATVKPLKYRSDCRIVRVEITYLTNTRKWYYGCFGAAAPAYILNELADQDITIGFPPEPSSDNPYAPGGTSGTGGGKGRFDSSSDPVDFPGLPTLSASRCGLITMFNPTVSELQQLSTKMWSKDFFDNVTKLISNPIDIIVALTIVPVSPPVSGREEVIAGLLSTGVSMNVVSSQYMSFSCGTYNVENFYDAALDYAPYTKASIYLPYIGVRQLNVDEIMGATLEIKYNIDLFTGACVAMIKVNNAVLYSFDGNIATQIPVNAANYASLYSSLIQGVASIATTAVTGGATAPSLAAQAASFSVNAVTSSKPTIQRAGGITGSNGLMAIQTPFLIFEIPRQSLPNNQQVYTGYPSNITYKLADLSGFTQVSDIHLDGIPATSEELTEIERLLKEGVII